MNPNGPGERVLDSRPSASPGPAVDEGIGLPASIDGKPASPIHSTEVARPRRSRDASGAPSITFVAQGHGIRRWRWLSAAALVLVALFAVTLLLPRLRSWLGSEPPAGLLFASGRIEGRITTLTPKSSAWVVALHVDEGQAVKAGQLLATLDDRAQRERVRSAEEQLNALTERLRAANTQLAMTERQVSLPHRAGDRGAPGGRGAPARARDKPRAGRARCPARRPCSSPKELIAAQEAEHAHLKADVEEHAVREAEEALVEQPEAARPGPRSGAQQIETMRAERDALERQRRQARGPARRAAEPRRGLRGHRARSPAGC